MKMYWIYFIFIKDGRGEDIGKENFFFGGGVKGISSYSQSLKTLY